MPGILFVVPTPIGNLEDMTFRAINTLKNVDYVLAEDTRTSSVLLKHFDIQKTLKSYHQHNEHKILNTLINDLINGSNIALISDAGTPGISDPGFLIVREAVKNNIVVQTLPGATAFTPALVNSGFAINQFSFYGFLPQKKGRQSKLKEALADTKTLVFYESPFRIEKFLNDVYAVLGDTRKLCVCREISKKFEEISRGTAAELIQAFKLKAPKGEFVIVVDTLNNEPIDTSNEQTT
ncbi:MAG: 16S rRNA (cytidine(1402)-2'-O)-methyltransferase [Bacteroidetes bacterium]|nr:16S rRNA (cytidine(1402)-2'-O)-methyltransferase [Bacteroidota bacterium]